MVFFLLLPLTGCSKDKFYSSLGFRAKTPESVEALAIKGLDYYEHGKFIMNMANTIRRKNPLKRC
jgi:hypothetical protein